MPIGIKDNLSQEGVSVMRHELLNPREIEILRYIVSEARTKGYPPSVREIAKATGLRSTSTVHGYLAKLEQKGFIRKDPSKPRAIEILDAAYRYVPDAAKEARFVRNLVQVPVVGRVTAGSPILAVENVEEYFPLPTHFVGSSEEVFMLKVRGDSMIGAGIFDGDFVIVRQQRSADQGDIVVALLEDEATVKRFYKEAGRIRLQPENPTLSPIYADDVTILGKVVGLVRRFQ